VYVAGKENLALLISSTWMWCGSSSA